MKLNLGCGDQLLPGWTNIDHPTWGNPKADDHHDLDQTPWPWPTNSATHILMDNVLEHLWDTHAALLELHRITQPGRWITIIVPHRDGPDACQADHKHLYDEHTLWPYTTTNKGRTGSKVEPLFTVIDQTIDHLHPFAWHQRHYLGRELLAWRKHRITWILSPLPTHKGGPHDQPTATTTQ